MRYLLRTLHTLVGIGPPLLAVLYRTTNWFGSYPAIPVCLTFFAVSILGPIACYRELIRMACGPDPLAPSRRRSRRVVRVRYERYLESS